MDWKWAVAFDQRARREASAQCRHAHSLLLCNNDSGQPNHKVVTHPSNSLAQDRESSPSEANVQSTMLRRQQTASFLIKRKSCLTSVCLSVAFIGPRLRTGVTRKTEIGTQVAHTYETRTPLSN